MWCSVFACLFLLQAADSNSKKTYKNQASQQTFGSSYFIRALVIYWSSELMQTLRLSCKVAKNSVSGNCVSGNHAWRRKCILWFSRWFFHQLPNVQSVYRCTAGMPSWIHMQRYMLWAPCTQSAVSMEKVEVIPSFKGNIVVQGCRKVGGKGRLAITVPDFGRLIHTV